MIYDESVGMRLLEIFRARNLRAAIELLPQGLEFEVSEIGNLEYQPKCSVNVKSKRLLCNLTMWSSGACDLLAIDENTDNDLINETNMLENTSDLQEYLDGAYKRLLAFTNGENERLG